MNRKINVQHIKNTNVIQKKIKKKVEQDILLFINYIFIYYINMNRKINVQHIKNTNIIQKIKEKGVEPDILKIIRKT